MAVSTKMAVFWVVALCSLVEIYQRFQRSLLPLSSGRCSTRLHGATTQKTAIYEDFIVLISMLPEYVLFLNMLYIFVLFSEEEAN
jgi:hypothetical protein